LQHGALVELFAAQRRGRSALRAHGENVDGFEHFHRIVLLDPCYFSTLKVPCRMRNVNRGDALQWIEKRAMMTEDF
jgi:hypothetical protein